MSLKPDDVASTEPRPKKPDGPGGRRALVLSGGGARGAYEAGVLSYVFEKLPEKLGFMPSFDVYSGTSVGAVHSCFLAAHAENLEAGAHALADIWRGMSFSTVYRFGVGDAFNFSRTVIGSLLGRSTKTSEHPDRIHGLLNTTPLEKLVVHQIPWRKLRRNLRSKVLDSLCVTTTEIATGRSVTFVDNRERRVGTWTTDPMFIARPERIGPEHALASAAIPILFPAVRVRDTYFCDGSLRMHSPLSPALRLGCDRVLAIGLRKASGPAADAELQAGRIEKFQSAGFMFGKILNTLLIDRLEHEIVQMRVVNQLLRAGTESIGNRFIEQANQALIQQRGLGFRVVKDCFIRPSEDIGMIAASHVRRMRKKQVN